MPEWASFRGSTSQIDGVLNALRRAGRRIRCLSGGRFMAQCPSHPDKNPSLSIRAAAGGNVLIRCFAGCPSDEVLRALGLRWPDLFVRTTKVRR